MVRSQAIFRRGLKKIPGGVNSPVRAWRAVGGSPLVIARGTGSRIFDADGKQYIDYVGSWGPLILGHAAPKVVRAVAQGAARGTSFGAPTAGEVEIAERVARAMPSIEKLRLVSSGTEAAMSAVRLARAYTGRSKIIKFDGCYHGHTDGLLVRAGSGVATLSLPDSAGVPKSFARETLVAKFNDIDSVERIFQRYPEEIAAVITEPVCGNMGVILPRTGFLAALRRLTARQGALLVFDEVITGFRVGIGGAQELYKIKPDLTCLGKILGGGLPLAAFGGRARIMDLLAPGGTVYQAGTLSGNPLAVAAGIATIKELSRPMVYERLEKLGRKLEEGFKSVIENRGLRAAVNRLGSMMTVFFGVDEVRRPDDARRADQKQFARFFHGMLERGIYLPPAPFEAMFVSLAHSQGDIEKTVAAFDAWSRTERAG